MYHAMDDILQQDILDVLPLKKGGNACDFLLYCFYGSHILLAQKNYSQALELLRYAIMCPTSVISAITIECMKRYYLVSVILKGTYTPPNNAYIGTQRHFGNNCGHYRTIAEAYVQKDKNHFQKLIKKYEKSFAEDNNIGLIQLVQDKYIEQEIKDLTLTYLTIPLQTISTQLGIEDINQVEEIIVRMINEGQLQALIDGKEKIVRFISKPEDLIAPETISKLQQVTLQIQHFNYKLASISEQVDLDKSTIIKKLGQQHQPSTTNEFSLRE